MKKKTPTDRTTRPLLIRLPPELRRALKYRAVELDTSMNALIVDAVKDKYGTSKK